MPNVKAQSSNAKLVMTDNERRFTDTRHGHEHEIHGPGHENQCQSSKFKCQKGEESRRL